MNTVKITTIYIIILLVNSVLLGYTENITVYKGWNLKGNTYEIKDLHSFLDKDIVKNIYTHRNGRYYSAIETIGTLLANGGFWIYAKKSGTLKAIISSTPSQSIDNTGTPPNLTRSYDDCYRWNEFSWNCDDNTWNSGCYQYAGNSWGCDNDDEYASRDDIIMHLNKGWNLKGTSRSFQIKDIFDNSCVEQENSIRVYYRFIGMTKMYDKNSPKQIASDMGFWVKANKNCTLRYKNSNDNNTAQDADEKENKDFVHKQEPR